MHQQMLLHLPVDNHIVEPSASNSRFPLAASPSAPVTSVPKSVLTLPPVEPVQPLQSDVGVESVGTESDHNRKSEQDDDPGDLDTLNQSPPDVIADNLPVSPSEDFRSYSDLIHKMALRLGISTSQPSQVIDDVVFDIIQM